MIAATTIAIIAAIAFFLIIVLRGKADQEGRDG